MSPETRGTIIDCLRHREHALLNTIKILSVRGGGKPRYLKDKLLLEARSELERINSAYKEISLDLLEALIDEVEEE